jgi:hypothetical protein
MVVEILIGGRCAERAWGLSLLGCGGSKRRGGDVRAEGAGPPW